MPIRIKPVHDLKPCVLDLESIKEICSLVEQNFNEAIFSGEDGVWEVYNEGKDNFISAISPRETLDSFTVEARNRVVVTKTYGNTVLNTAEIEKDINILFNKYQATVKFSGPHDLENWFEHFMFDLKKHLRAPSFRQRLLAESGKGDYGPLGITIPAGSMAAGIIKLGMSSGSARYCQIVLHKRPPSAFIENIKANLVSNLIWVVIVFTAGVAFTFFTLWIYRKYGFNINEWFTPNVPTPTRP
jgi:hypothetical protein